MPLETNILAGGAARGTLLAVTSQSSEQQRNEVVALGATVVVLPSDPAGHVDLAALLAELGRRGVRTVMVEGGATLITEMLRARLVDRVVVTIAPKILGNGIDAVGDLGIDELSRAVEIVEPVIERYGADVVMDGRIRFAEEDRG